MAKRKQENTKPVDKANTAPRKVTDLQSPAYAVNHHSPLLEGLPLNLVSNLPKLFDIEPFTLILEHNLGHDRFQTSTDVMRKHKTLRQLT